MSTILNHAEAVRYAKSAEWPSAPLLQIFLNTVGGYVCSLQDSQDDNQFDLFELVTLEDEFLRDVYLQSTTPGNSESSEDRTSKDSDEQIMKTLSTTIVLIDVLRYIRNLSTDRFTKRYLLEYSALLPRLAKSKAPWTDFISIQHQFLKQRELLRQVLMHPDEPLESIYNRLEIF